MKSCLAQQRPSANAGCCSLVSGFVLVCVQLCKAATISLSADVEEASPAVVGDGENAATYSNKKTRSLFFTGDFDDRRTNRRI